MPYLRGDVGVQVFYDIHQGRPPKSYVGGFADLPLTPGCSGREKPEI
jgi:hypothetical protein